MADKNRTEKRKVGFAPESVKREPNESSSDSSKGDDNYMDWNHAAVTGHPSCLRQSLSRMASSARTRIGSFHAITGLGHGGLMASSQPLKNKSSIVCCEHVDPYVSEEGNGNLWEIHKVLQFRNKPTWNIKKRIKSEGSSCKDVQDHSAYTRDSTLRSPSDDVSMDDSCDEEMDLSSQGNDDAMAMRGQKRPKNDMYEDDGIETGDSTPKRMSVD